MIVSAAMAPVILALIASGTAAITLANATVEILDQVAAKVAVKVPTRTERPALKTRILRVLSAARAPGDAITAMADHKTLISKEHAVAKSKILASK